MIGPVLATYPVMHTDNLGTIQASIINALRDSIFNMPGLTERCMARLNQDLDRGFERGFGRTMYMEFEREDPRANCTLTVGFENEDWGPKNDEDGSLWYQWTLSVKVNYPCHGADDITTVRSRIVMVAKVCEIGERLEYIAKDIEIWSLYKSAAQVAADEAKRAAEKAQAKVDAAEPPKYMRVGHSDMGPALDVPAGSYTTKRGEKVFTVDVDTNRGVDWTRVA